MSGTNCHPWHHSLLVNSGLVDPKAPFKTKSSSKAGLARASSPGVGTAKEPKPNEPDQTDQIETADDVGQPTTPSRKSDGRGDGGAGGGGGGNRANRARSNHKYKYENPWALSRASIDWLLEVLVDSHAQPSVVCSWTYILSQVGWQ